MLAFVKLFFLNLLNSAKCWVDNTYFCKKVLGSLLPFQLPPQTLWVCTIYFSLLSLLFLIDYWIPFFDEPLVQNEPDLLTIQQEDWGCNKKENNNLEEIKQDFTIKDISEKKILEKNSVNSLDYAYLFFAIGSVCFILYYTFK